MVKINCNPYLMFLNNKTEWESSWARNLNSFNRLLLPKDSQGLQEVQEMGKRPLNMSASSISQEDYMLYMPQESTC